MIDCLFFLFTILHNHQVFGLEWQISILGGGYLYFLEMPESTGNLTALCLFRRPSSTADNLPPFITRSNGCDLSLYKERQVGPAVNFTG